MTLCIFFGVFASCTAYLIVIGDFLTPLVESLLPNLSDARTVTVTVACTFIMFPLSLYPELRRLAPFSAFAMSALWLLVVLIVISTLQVLQDNDQAPDIHWVTRRFPVEEWYGWFRVLPIIAFSFNGQPVLVPLFAELQTSLKPKAFSQVILPSTVTASVMFISVGFLGYLQFGNDVQADVLLEFDDNDTFANVVRIAISIAVMLHYPLVLFPMRQSLDSLMFPGSELTFLRTTLQTAGIILTTLVISLVFPSVERVFGLAGGTIGSLLCYIIPGMLLYQLPNPTRADTVMRVFLPVFGVIFTLLTTLATILTNLYPLDIDQN